MRERALDRSRAKLNAGVPAFRAREDEEAVEFLEWLADNHFTFLGYREYKLERRPRSDRLVAVPRSGLGLLRTGAAARNRKPHRAHAASCSARRAKSRC